MKNIMVMGSTVLLAFMLTLGIVHAQPMAPGMMHHGGGQGQAYGPQQQGGGMTGGMMMQGGMMPGMASGPMGMGAGVGIHGMMGPFHAWIARLMANRQALDLSAKQMEQLDEAIAEHLKAAIRNRAEARVLRVDLRQALRGKAVDLKTVKALLRKIADLDFQLQMAGVGLYTKVLEMLTDQQRTKVMEIVGSPFPAPWEERPMGPGMGMPGVAPSGTEAPPRSSQGGEEKAGSGGMHPHGS